MFQFSCRFSFLSTFCLSNWTPTITRSIKKMRQLWCRSVRKTKFWSLYEFCKGSSAWQFITEIQNKGWTKNSINRLLVKFETVDRRPGSVRCSAHTDENVDTVESLLLSQEDKPQSHRTVREISRDAGIHRSSVSQIIHKDLRLKCSKKWRAQQLTEVHSMHALFLVCSLRDDNVIRS